jgi:hypothetical protein
MFQHENNVLQRGFSSLNYCRNDSNRDRQSSPGTQVSCKDLNGTGIGTRFFFTRTATDRFFIMNNSLYVLLRFLSNFIQGVPKVTRQSFFSIFFLIERQLVLIFLPQILDDISGRSST